jgi:hypothetical protein
VEIEPTIKNGATPKSQTSRKNKNLNTMANLSCPKCSELTKKGGYKIWQIIVAICFFPLGLLALLADKEVTTCQKCHHTWQA